jgi:hypothetical protein
VIERMPTVFDSTTSRKDAGSPTMLVIDPIKHDQPRYVSTHRDPMHKSNEGAGDRLIENRDGCNELTLTDTAKNA